MFGGVYRDGLRYFCTQHESGRHRVIGSEAGGYQTCFNLDDVSSLFSRITGKESREISWKSVLLYDCCTCSVLCAHTFRNSLQYGVLNLLDQLG